MTGDADRKAVAVGARLAAAYRAIAARTRDLPIYNHALTVEAVGFRAHEGVVLGVVVTPWFMNLVAVNLPGGLGRDPLPNPLSDPLPPGATARRSLPAGVIDFTVAEIAGIGRVDSASLFSPMFGFADPAVARATAEAALAAVLEPDIAAPPPPPPVERTVPGRRGLLFGRARIGGGP
jgi:[NiFe] hydrogenase assembly HybE family chaperone